MTETGPSGGLTFTGDETMRRWKKSDPYFTVTRTDTHGGCGIKALTPAEAVERAKRYGFMKGATRVKVQLHCGPYEGPRVTFFDV